MIQKREAEKYYKWYAEIELQDFEIKKIDAFVERLIPEKMKQSRFKNDNPKILTNSFHNAYIAESAIQNFLGINFIRWDIKSETEKAVPDLMDLGLPIGIKTCQWGNFPLIWKPRGKVGIKTPEIITILQPPNKVLISGFATIPVLSHFQNPNFVFGTAFGKKGGFWGFHKLHRFNNQKELETLFHNKNLDNEKFTETLNSFMMKQNNLLPVIDLGF